MFELKKSGYKRKELQSELDKLYIVISVFDDEIHSAFQRKNEFINQEKHRHGVISLEEKIREIEQKKAKFLNSFDYEENKQIRKREHREIWSKKK